MACFRLFSALSAVPDANATLSTVLVRVQKMDSLPFSNAYPLCCGNLKTNQHSAEECQHQWDVVGTGTVLAVVFDICAPNCANNNFFHAHV